jgi:methionyl-tRNA formyltransferase
MRIIVFASGEFAIPTMRRLADSPHEVAAMVTQPSRPRGRGRQPSPTPAAERAAELGMPVLECADVNEAAFVARVRELDARLGIVIAFGQKLGRDVMGAIRCGCVNLHGSLLPKYRGAAPIAWAILCGEEKTGVTVFRLTDRMDAGEVLVRRETLIRPDETVGELHDRLAMIGPDAIGATLEAFENDDSPPGERQDERFASIAPKLNKQAGLLDFRRDASKLERHIRAMSPWPGARCVFRSADGRHHEEVTLARTRLANRAPEALRGDVGLILDGYAVQTGRGSLEILEIQPQGGRVMAWQDFVNGRHVKPGDRFEALPSEQTT